MATDAQNNLSDELVGPSITNPSKALDAPQAEAEAEAEPEAPPTTGDSSKDSEDSKTAVAAPATVSDVEKKVRRAERFGMTVQLTEKEKRNSRAERFGTATGTVSSSPSGSEVTKNSEELKRKARAERFGIPTPATASEVDAKKKARLARFSPAATADPLEDEKKKARALRFATTPSKSLSQENGKGNIEPPKAVVAGNAGGD